MTHTLRVLLLFLSIPTLLCAQQNKPPANASAPVAASTVAQPVSAYPKTPAEFFARARQLSDLEAAGIPFHLKATYVATGDTEDTGNGTYEEWWQSKDMYRTETTLGGYQSISVKNGKFEQLYETPNSAPSHILEADAAVLVRITPETAASGLWKLKRKKISGAYLTVLSKTKPVASGGGAFIRVEDSFTSEGLLRIHRKGKLATYYDNFQPFKNLLIPRDVKVIQDHNTLLVISVEMLEPLVQNEETISKITSPPKNLPKSGRTIRITFNKFQRPQIISQVPPVYPLYAKEAGIQGVVLVHATIDGKGKVRNPYVLSSPDPMLNAAALHAVRQWRYKPCVLGGEPVSVDTTITIIFSLNR